MKTDKEKIQELEYFLRKAFCIDGLCIFDGFTETVCGEKIGGFKLNDSRRGLFKVYISI